MGDAILSLLLELCKLLTFVSVCPCKSISTEGLFQSRSKEETGQNKMARWVEKGVWELELLFSEGQLLCGSLCWKYSPGDLPCGMLSAPGVEPGAGWGTGDLGPALTSHLPSHPCSFGLFFQRLVR